MSLWYRTVSVPRVMLVLPISATGTFGGRCSVVVHQVTNHGVAALTCRSRLRAQGLLDASLCGSFRHCVYSDLTHTLNMHHSSWCSAIQRHMRCRQELWRTPIHSIGRNGPIDGEQSVSAECTNTEDMFKLDIQSFCLTLCGYSVYGAPQQSCSAVNVGHLLLFGPWHELFPWRS